MKKSDHHKPPVWATRLLAWYCRPALFEDLEGDLNEYFTRNVKLKGWRTARLIYILDVIKFFRPYTVRRLTFFNRSTHWIMINPYVKVSGRIILRNRLFSFINIVGLGLSMVVGLLLVGLLSDMHAYDKFNVNHDHIYRVISTYQYLDEDPNDFASTSRRTAKAIQESIAGIENIAVVQREFSGDVETGERTVPLSGFWASASFFTVFTFPMINGDPSTALENPFSVVLTEASSIKLFGSAAALGKQLVLNGKDYVVTGVIKDVPRFSHMKFDMLASINTRDIMEKDNPNEMAWDNIWNTYTYLLLPDRTDKQNFQTNLNAICAAENRTIKNSKIGLSLQPLDQIAMGKDLNNSIGHVMDSNHVWMIGVLAVIVILSACFNYTNLSVARSLRRSREVGIRKIVGAYRSHVIGQFIVESVVIALCALLFSFLLFVFLKPYFLSLNPQYREMLTLNISPKILFYFIVLALVVGIAAGIFPALFFSRINAIHVLKNISVIQGFRGITLRKGLIVAQFCISLMFIAATIIGYKHYRQVLAFDLGFDTENILNIRMFGNNPALFKQQLKEMPEVQDVSTSSLITSVGNYWVVNMKYNDPHDSARVYYNFVDEHYLALHHHTLMAGKNFQEKKENSAEDEVIVNEKVLQRFKIAGEDPSSALGEMLAVNGKTMKIIGVIKDFQYGKSIDRDFNEFIFRYSPTGEYVNAKILSPDWVSTRGKIEAAWKKIDNVHPLEATFYDDEIERSYHDFSSRLKIIGVLSFLAIGVASVGLLGMVVFSTETRLREISIRKVMGASEGSLVLLLSRSFVLLLSVAAAIALPATQFFFARYVLSDYAEHAPLAWSELIMGMTVVMAVATVMIGSHTLKAASANPADVLKRE